MAFVGSAISKVVASVATLQNETTFALSKFNLDFTIIKLEAPKDYKSVEESISSARKHNAEAGGLHKTARKLGALFDGKAPLAPELFRDYGTGVSELCEIERLNPTGKSRHALFSKHVGADSTSIWAAVTSGDGAVAVHLLACMIARMFTGPQAISLWMALIEKRKEEIGEGIANTTDQMKAIAAACAAQQEVRREEIADWDSSARSWIQSADLIKVKEHSRAMLMTDASGLEVNNESNTYRCVMQGWKDAMIAMNNLVTGIPQRVESGAALLGMTSWHLYPDLIVLQKGIELIKQRDNLVADTGILTVGLHTVGEPQGSVSWSLPLAYMQYYGTPIRQMLIAAEQYEVVDNIEQAIARKLVGLGQRHGDFVCDPSDHPSPVFGLSEMPMLFRASYCEFKGLCRRAQISNADGVIHYRHTEEGITVDEYTTIETVKRDLGDESLGYVRRHGLSGNTSLGKNIRRIPIANRYFRSSLIEPYRDKDCKKSKTRVYLQYWIGDRTTAEIVRIGREDTRLGLPTQGTKQMGESLSARSLNTMFKGADFDHIQLTEWLASTLKSKGYKQYVTSLQACASAAEIYTRLPDTTIESKIVEQSLTNARWIATTGSTSTSSLRLTFSRPQVFAYIAMFDSGTFNLDPEGLKEVFAISSGNSIFVASPLSCDPYEKPTGVEIQRVPGNIGYPGLSLLIPPPDPKILKPGLGNWQHLDYKPSRGVLEDNLLGTSIHLSFSGYELPLQSLDMNRDGYIMDRPVRLVEIIAQVFDRERWIADLDIMAALENIQLSRVICRANKEDTDIAYGTEYSILFDGDDLAAADDWDEILTLNGGSLSVMRATGSWLARLAATVINV
ncbi:uncharacterized protein EAF01_011880 [Botrytis porri]|uniref:uncharacterized protein n=1 Tax=Botrytis porri TaxID=87229 RepID=UPI0018FF6D4D|nr:uncharacterized protein EAF01_011880 [Botrytis porri]KAF7881369.1 hypothetical protein EAF01_011880 [Botrytis porri]